jgi:hypothetical protein
VTKDDKIRAYNRLQGTMAVLDEMIKLYKPEPEVLSEMLMAYQALKMAQNNLGWDPGGKVSASSAK